MPLINSTARSWGDLPARIFCTSGSSAPSRWRESQRIGQGEDFEIGVNRLFREQAEFQRNFAGIGEFAQSLAVGFWAFIAGAQQGAGDVEALACRTPRRPSRKTVRSRLGGQHVGGARNSVIGGQRLGEFRFAGELRLEIRLGFGFCRATTPGPAVRPGGHRSAFGVFWTPKNISRARRAFSSLRALQFASSTSRRLSDVEAEGQ